MTFFMKFIYTKIIVLLFIFRLDVFAHLLLSAWCSRFLSYFFLISVTWNARKVEDTKGETRSNMDILISEVFLFWMTPVCFSLHFNLLRLHNCVYKLSIFILNGGGGTFTLIGLFLPQLGACPYPGPGFSTSVCSIIWGKKWLSVLLMLVEWLPTTV